MGKTMKRIPLDNVPQTLFGRPFRIQDLEQEPPAEVYRCDKCGGEITVEKPVMIEKANLIELLKMLILNIPRQSCTMQDSINAYDFMQQAGESEDGMLKVTDGIHDWLKKTCEKYGMQIYSVNAQAVMAALDGFEKPHQPADKE